MSQCRTFLALFTIILTTSLYAESFPNGCEARNYKFEGNDLIINETGDQRLYLLYNHSNEVIELTRRGSGELFMSPSLLVKLSPKTWGAFASDIPYLAFQCHINNGQNVRKINCGATLDVCEYPRAKFALSNMGNYWVSANKSKHEIVSDAASKGIYLRW